MSFVHPLFLAGLAAIGLPVLIHFLTRARPRIIRFPTYRLLVEAGSGRQALHRLRTWIVLALRTLLVAALVLLFARPSFDASGALADSDRARRVVVVVDASASMRAVRASVTSFTRAKARAADFLRSLPRGSAAAVIAMGDTPRPLLPALSRNLAALHAELSVAEATHERGRPEAALALAERLLDGSGEVVVFSDFQATNWRSVELSGREGLAVYLRPLEEDFGVDNVGLVSIDRAPEEPIEGETVELSCRVFNSSSLERLATVKLDLEGITRSEELVLAPYGEGVAVFSFSLPRPGFTQGLVSLDGDDLAVDDRRFFSLRTRPSLAALILSDTDERDTRSGAFYLRMALAPSEYAGTGIEAVHRRSQDVDRGILETADAFFLVPPLRLSGETLEVIARRAREGAQLVCFLDGPTSPPLLNGLIGASEGELVPPFALGEPLRASSPESWVAPRTVSGPLRLFDAPERGDLGGLRFLRHFATESAAAREDEILARYSDGSVALALSPLGKGAMVIGNFPLSPDGGNLTASPLFPALVHELLKSLRQSGRQVQNHPGRPWQLEARGVEPSEGDGEGAGGYRVVGPLGDETAREIPATVLSSGRTVRLAADAVALPGVYAVRFGDDPRPVGLGVVNVHADETDTRPADLEELVGESSGRGAVAVLRDDGRLVALGEAEELWPRLAGLAALALLLEMVLLAFWRKGSQAGAGGLA